jgi:hypothetical protein
MTAALSLPAIRVLPADKWQWTEQFGATNARYSKK